MAAYEELGAKFERVVFVFVPELHLARLRGHREPERSFNRPAHPPFAIASRYADVHALVPATCEINDHFIGVFAVNKEADRHG